MGGKGSGRFKPGDPAARNPKSPMVQAASWNVQDGDLNAKIIAHGMRVLDLPKLDLSDPDAVRQRISDYFAACAEDVLRPTVEGMGNWLGMNRGTLSNIMGGFTQGVTLGVTPASYEEIKKGYDILSQLYASNLSEEKGSPVKWIFYGKNNFGYVDQKEQRVIHEDKTKRLSGATADEVASKYAQLVGVEDIPEAETYELPAGDDK